MKKTKKILMACHNYWTSPFQVGSHHLARQFVRLGYEVAFISDPISPLHFLGGRKGDLAEKLRINRQGGLRDLDGKLWAYVPFSLVTPHNSPILRSSWVYRSWVKLSLPNVVQKVRQMGFGQVDLLYLDSLYQSFWLGQVQARHSLFRVADFNQGFERATSAALDAEEKLVRGVEAVAYTARGLEEPLRKMNPKKLVYLPNGVHFSHFAGPLPPKPPEYAGFSVPPVIYVGAMEEWFHFDWVFRAAAALPKIPFVLIGLAPSSIQGRAPGNVHFLGAKPYPQIPAYLRHASVGIIPFNREKYPALVDRIHPLKLYEYMACGLPVVATDWDEIRRLRSPARLCSTAGEFTAELKKALRHGRRGLSVDYARKQDWSKRAKILAGFLKGGD